MASTYTDRLHIEKPGVGEQDNTWGTTLNTQRELIDEAVAGVASVTHDDTANYTLTDNNGSSSEARHAVLEIGGALTAARNVVCPTEEKVYIVKNATTGGYAVTIKTSGGTGISIPNGDTRIVYCDGTNVVDAITDLATGTTINGAVIVTETGTQTLTNKTLTTPVLSNPSFSGTTSNMGTVTTIDINGGTADGLVIGGSSAAAGTFTNLTASGTIVFTGATITNLGTVTTADINGGTLDGVIIGGSSAAAATVTNLTASGTIVFTGATITNLGTVTTADINGGTIDGVTIGGSSAGAGTFVNLTATGTITLDGTAIAEIKAYDLGFTAGFTSAFADQDLVVQTYGEHIVGRSVTITGEVGYAGTAPTGTAAIFDILKNGVTIYSTKPQFDAGSTSLTAGTLNGAQTLASGDRVTFKCTQIGSTEPGGQVRFTLKTKVT